MLRRNVPTVGNSSAYMQTRALRTTPSQKRPERDEVLTKWHRESSFKWMAGLIRLNSVIHQRIILYITYSKLLALYLHPLIPPSFLRLGNSYFTYDCRLNKKPSRKGMLRYVLMLPIHCHFRFTSPKCFISFT